MDRDMVNCLHYLYQWGDSANDLEALKTKLTAEFAAVTARYPHEGGEPRF